LFFFWESQKVFVRVKYIYKAIGIGNLYIFK